MTTADAYLRWFNQQIGAREGMVNPADLAGIAELSGDLNVSRTRICNWASRHHDFPKPVVSLAAGPIYSLAAVRAWWEGRTR